MNRFSIDHLELNTHILVPIIYNDDEITTILYCTMLFLKMFCVLAYFGYAVAWIGLVRTFPLAEQTKNNNKRITANATILESKRNSQVSGFKQQFGAAISGGKYCLYRYKRKKTND